MSECIQQFLDEKHTLDGMYNLIFEARVIFCGHLLETGEEAASDSVVLQ